MDAFFANSTIFSPSVSNLTDGKSKCKDTTAQEWMWTTAATLSALLGLPANVMVLYFVLRNTAGSSTSDTLTMNLAVLDCLVCLLMPLAIVNHFFTRNRHIDEAITFFYYLKESGGPLFLCCMCVDRYLAVLRPITFIRLRDHKYRTGSSAISWVLSLTYSIYTCVIHKTSVYYVFGAFFTTAFGIIVFCNLSILRALRQSGPGRKEIHPMKKKAFKIVLSILGSVAISYFPAVFALIFENVSTAILCYFTPLTLSFLMLSTFTQPLIYLFMARKLPCLLKNSGTSVCFSFKNPFL